MNIVLRVMAAWLLVCLAFPQPGRAGGALGEDPYEIGEKLAAKKNFRTAVKYYQKALKQNPQRSEALERITAIEAQLQQEQADKTSGLLDQGKSLAKKRKYGEALKVLRQAASKDTSNPEIHFQLGEVYLQLGEYDKAKAEYDQAKRNFRSGR